ncbi:MULTISPECIES: prolyl oligopeptidase family serine peptidase [Sphingobium]|jgi:dipeptidyl aminopeptidase/acylaminoacyl peptidase|nr:MULTISPECIES: prolyl oligopeptidase family serine peptidase [Sphingobium]
MNNKAAWLLATVFLTPHASFASQPIQKACFERLATYAIERPRIPGSWMERPQFDLSPDGDQLIYVERSANVADNSLKDGLWIVDLHGGVERKLISTLQTSSDAADLRLPNPLFSPDGTRVAVVGNRGITIFGLRGEPPNIIGVDDAKIADFLWSPDGKSLAVLLVTLSSYPLRSGYQAPPDWDGASRDAVRHRLVILDSSSGTAIAEAPASYDLVGIDSAFSWSPDGRKIAFSAQYSSAATSGTMGPNIYVWDLGTQDIETYVEHSGPNLDPHWSPDGRRIAYLTADGRDPLTSGLQLVVQGTNGRDRLIISKPDETTGTPYLPNWIDADHLAYVAMRQMECPVFEVDVNRGTGTLLGQQPLSCFGGIKVGIRGRLFMTRQNFENPGEVVSTQRHRWAPAALAGLSSSLRLPWRAEAVSWQSKDDDYVIHGVLIRPNRQRAASALLVSVPGGPAMVTPDSYNDDAPFLPYGPLLSGFSILVPNTRGRGGYGRDFEAAIRNRKDYVEGPLEDVLGGVDYVTKQFGIPKSRLALAGFSYGGILTAYAASNVHAFRAAMSMEGVVDFYSRALLEYGGPNQRAADANMGYGNPYDIGERARLLSQSPLSSIDGLQTPVLLECGESSLGPTDCLKFFRTGNSRGSAPVELAIYPRTGHRILEPALRLDSAKRQVEWLRKWIPTSPLDTEDEDCQWLQ